VSPRPPSPSRLRRGVPPRTPQSPAVFVKRLVMVHLAVWVALTTVLTAPAIRDLFRFDAAAVLARPWSIVTYPLIHDGFVHVTSLMAILALAGPAVVSHLGSRRFLLYYVYCTVGGAAAGLILSGLLTTTPMGGALAPVLGILVARSWIGANDKTTGSTIRLGVLGLAVALTAGVLTASVALPVPAVALPHIGGLFAGYLFWRLWSVGHQSPPVTPLPIRHVVLTRIRAEHDHASEHLEPSPSGPEPLEPPLDSSTDLLDRLLDKISAGGLESLTEDERASLAAYAERKRRGDA